MCVSTNGVRRILIVDDNRAIHDDFRKVLSCVDDSSELNAAEAELFGEEQPFADEIQYDIADAYQGEDGFNLVGQAVAEHRAFDMAFVDMRMPPGWDGLETIENLWKVDSELQIVICSAYSDYHLSQIRQRLGTTDKLLILKKPFDDSEVYQLAAALTEKRRLARKARLRMDELERLVKQRTNELSQLNRIDPLTGALNRRGLEEAVEHCTNLCDTIAMTLVDVDCFKLVNDEYGHPAGDAALQHIVQCIRRVARNSDTVGRLGGDEFLVLLPGTHRDAALELAELLRWRIAESPFVFDGRRIGLRVSIGIASGEPGDSVDQLLANCDRALYTAKNSGRNAVRVFDMCENCVS